MHNTRCGHGSYQVARTYPGSNNKRFIAAWVIDLQLVCGDRTSNSKEENDDS